jgi:DNA-binding NarL/FixJ family response regulator
VREEQSEAVIGVAVIEDQQETREGISLLINRTVGFECRHLYGAMEAALEGIGLNPPRVALVDIGLRPWTASRDCGSCGSAIRASPR